MVQDIDVVLQDLDRLVRFGVSTWPGSTGVALRTCLVASPQSSYCLGCCVCWLSYPDIMPGCISWRWISDVICQKSHFDVKIYPRFLQAVWHAGLHGTCQVRHLLARGNEVLFQCDYWLP
ncbi:hypothetical protein B296_00004822 [Ensete ventricosum]|uniref:Uncharacterized protein n=1 Tax=Ensete ventricosum TaxID=4639 RepID=A0A426ZXN1_ENSVE|nr:hypothetical protein B296_00004822 [Ensete ventricosum]